MDNKEIVSGPLLEILRCPSCKEPVKPTTYGKDENGLRCARCKVIYPVRDNIPIMLSEEAVKE